MYLGDFHIHSQFSDGSLSIPEIVDNFGSRGFGAIAITDHACEEVSPVGRLAHYAGKTLTRATFPLYQEILKSEIKRAWSEYGMVLIPGVELTKNSLFNHRSAHIVALGMSDWIDPHLDPKEMAREIRDQGGLAIAAHPLSPSPLKNRPYYLWDRRHELKDEFDAWEVTYGAQMLSEVMDSGLPRIASSDLHRPEQIRSWKTGLKCARAQESIFQAIREQEISIEYYQGEETRAFDLGLRPLGLGRRLWAQPLGNWART